MPILYFKNLKWPTLYQWSQFFKILGKKESYLFFGFCVLIAVSAVFVGYRIYKGNTEVAPALGGIYREGIIGSPRYLNPVLAQTNDADRDVTRVIFSGLFKYNSKGAFIPDLAESYQIGDSGKTYEVFLRKNAFWHDGQPVTAEDVIYTISIIKDPNYRSPLRANWYGVEVEKIDDFAIRFKLKNPYAAFLSNLTAGILPKHIWQNISFVDFPLSERNLKPIGSGPYFFKKLEKNKDGTIKTLELEAFKDFYLEGPYLSQIVLRFFGNEDDALASWRKGEIQGVSYVSAVNYQAAKNRQNNGVNIYSLSLPRSFSLFFNQEIQKTLSDKNVRLAMAHAIDKNELVRQVLGGFGQPIHSPIPPGMLGYSNDIKIYEFNIDKAKEILESNGWVDKDGDGIREKIMEKGKDPVKLEFTLTTISWPELVSAADFVKNSWEKIGIKTNVEANDALSVQQENIKSRQYQILLFGEVLNIDPDPFSFWHSSQKKDPGLNIAVYDNSKVDAILQDARQDIDQASRAKKYEEFSKIIVEDLPAIFLYSPSYLYPLSNQIKGIDFKKAPENSEEKIFMPSDRFSEIEKWYIKTKRTWHWKGFFN
ncbi:MAG: ABC transporter substrate-binding protein [Candidatus Portnoybacteria bacterium]|nr:ABC transporter substrate-binding protein [Candidatus Portnoybacteria bacterium]